MTMQELIYLIQGSNDLLEMGNFLPEDKSVAWCLIIRLEVCLLLFALLNKAIMKLLFLTALASAPGVSDCKLSLTK